MKLKHLELEGFTAYREREPVNFEGADLFAIIGPTGAGKSSLIDAMIFALYGSMPRLDDQKLVHPIISQGRLEARVSCRFGLDGADYTVTRVVRRAASGAARATTKEARLERDGSETPIASGGPEVTRAVIDLIGLTFDQFTKCVVLPQGAFARFLHDRAQDRRDLVNQLLGLGRYERMTAAARTRAGAARGEMEAYARQIEALAAVTAEREREAAARAAAIADLAATFRRDRPAIENLGQQAETRRREADADEADRERLSATIVPPEVGALADRRREIETKRGAARDDITRLGGAVREAQTRRAALGDLQPLVTRQAAFRQLADTRSQLDAARTDATQATTAARQANTAYDEATTRRAALGDLAPLVERQGLLRQLAARRTEAADAETRRAEAAAARDRAQDAVETTARAHAAAGDIETLTRQRDLLARLQDARGRLTRSGTARDRARSAADAARAAARTAATAEQAALAARDRLQADHYAHALRLGLRPGEPCPVCAQAVTALPDHPPPAGLEEAARELTEAGQHARAADAAHRDAGAALAAADAEFATHERDAAGITAALADAAPDGDAARIDDVTARIDAAAAARTSHEAAVRQLAAADAAHEAAAATAATRRDAAAALAREADDGDTAAGAGTDPDAIDRRIAAIHAADTQVRDTDAARQRAGAALAAADARRAHLEAEAARLDAATADDPDAAEVDAAIETIHAADREIDGMRQAQQAAEHARATADRDLGALADDEQALWRRLDKMRVAVIRHDPPAPDRPAGLRASWETMVEWAGTTAVTLHTRIDAARTEADASATRRRQRLDTVLAELAVQTVDVETAEAGTAPIDGKMTGAPQTADSAGGTEALDGNAHGHSLIDDGAGGAGPVDEGGGGAAGHEDTVGAAPVDEDTVGERLAAAEAAAKADLATVTSQRRTKRDHEQRHDDARARADVASRLAKLLGPQQFQTWRLRGAFDRLVAAASTWLRDLSSNAYSLAHTARLDFEVIDHANADERRPVRTLSGGETFLASLALALALADQVGDLASAGTARLDSMFLDEGFGSLDPETLETVATALDGLSAKGRTLGIVTHVPALAERMPVQFRVTKDGATARVQRSP